MINYLIVVLISTFELLPVYILMIHYCSFKAMQIHQNNVLKHIDHKIDCFKDPIPYLDLNDMMKMYMKT